MVTKKKPAKKPQKEMGRPKLFDDPKKEEQLKAICRLKPTLLDCAAFLSCSGDTIERFIRKKYDKTFAEFRHENMVHTRFGLIRDALERAKRSDTMLIFCLKNLCNWTDKAELLQEEDKVINIKMQ